jgi:hypothetical protein
MALHTDENKALFLNCHNSGVIKSIKMLLYGYMCIRTMKGGLKQLWIF